MKKEIRDDLSRFMSLILRHKPQEFGITLDLEGYCYLDDLLVAIQQKKRWANVTKEDILEVVKLCEKQRFKVVDIYIRAQYGHSAHDVQYKEGTPPAILYHGTYEGAVEDILATGIKKMNRKNVHLSETLDFAEKAGSRRGKPRFFIVDTVKARATNFKFYHAGNEVWLSDDIPVEFITLMDDEQK